VSLTQASHAFSNDQRRPDLALRFWRETRFWSLILPGFLVFALGGCENKGAFSPDSAGFGPNPNPALAGTLADPVIEPSDKLHVRVVPAGITKSPHMLEAHDLIQVRFAFGPGDYHIMPGDDVNVQFAENAKLDVRAVVRPDGKMTFPNLGDLTVAGRSPTEAAKDIAQMYGSRMNKPDNTVSVVSANTQVVESLTSELTVRPDGNVSVPLLGEFHAAGQSPSDLSLLLTKAASSRFQNNVIAYVSTRERATSQEFVASALLGYDKVVDVALDGQLVLPEIGAISTRDKTLTQLRTAIAAEAKERYTNPLQVSVTLEPSERRSIFLAGEVNKPGKYAWSAGMSSMKALALAGGTTSEGNLRGIVLIHYERNGSVTVYRVNDKAVVVHQSAFTDVSLSPQDMIYIPKTTIAKADLFVQQYIEKLVPFTRSINYSYSTTPGLPIF
jgi:protein involved in polysaccharide export with SLBB domain